MAARAALMAGSPAHRMMFTLLAESAREVAVVDIDNDWRRVFTTAEEIRVRSPITIDTFIDS